MALLFNIISSIFSFTLLTTLFGQPTFKRCFLSQGRILVFLTDRSSPNNDMFQVSLPAVLDVLFLPFSCFTRLYTTCFVVLFVWFSIENMNTTYLSYSYVLLSLHIASKKTLISSDSTVLTSCFHGSVFVCYLK